MDLYAGILSDACRLQYILPLREGERVKVVHAGERKEEMNYQEFLKTKIEIAPESGFEVQTQEINKALLSHQKDAVKWALQGGRRALFESFGLGKTVQEIEFCHLAAEHEGGRALIVLPLGVKQEFTRDAVEVLGYEKPEYCRTMEEVKASKAQIVLTNYERVRDGDIRPDYFCATSLDEASVLRSFGSKTYQTFLDKFKNVPYKLVATATPSPNRYKELIHYAGYLEVMDTGQALTRFFQRDSTKANNLTLYPNMEDEFWLWVSSWALFITKPSDIDPDYSDEGYELPPLQVRWHEILVRYGDAQEKDGQMSLFQEAAAGLKDAAEVKRNSIDIRVEKLKEIVEESPGDHFVLWHDLEAERHAIKKALPETVEIYGSQDYDIREKRVIDFSEGRTRLFATKKSLSGSGCNFQKHCHREIFLGIDYEFNDFIQAVHRCYRFLQSEQVVIDIIYMENEQKIKEVLLEKWKNHNHMVKKMIEIVKKYGLSAAGKEERLKRKMGVETVRIEGKNYVAVHDDCVEETRRMEENSIGLIHTSIPFGNHYEYSANYNDFGHNENTERFFEQMDFLTPELLRVLKPGRVAAVHVKDRVLFGNATGTGMPTIEPFHAQCIEHYTKHGFQYFGMITVLTDVVRENNQTYRLGWSEQCKDGSKMGVGCPEYILLFRKLPSDRSNAYADEPVVKTKDEYTRAQWQIDAHGYWRSSGDRLIRKEELKQIAVDNLQKVYREFSRDNVYSYEEHVKLAKELDEDGKLPATFMVVAPGSWNTLEVWDDINRMRTLNTNQSRRRAQMHVCPLQLDIVERIINRYSNEGDTVYDPFGGLMTVPMTAVKMHRKGYGCELNPDYFRDGVGYLQAAEDEIEAPTLFDFMGNPGSGSETGQQEETKQPELPKLKNNDQRKEWLNNYKDWGLWYRDENTECEYYKYDFENGARLIAETYRRHSEYTGDYESCYLHLVGGPVVKNAKWDRHEKYSKYPDGESAIVEFLKYIQKERTQV